MRVLFQEKPYDLVVSVSYAVGLAAGLLVTGARSLFAVLLIVIVPGYVLVAALFPGNDGIDWLERIALSLALSIVVVSLVGLVLDATPWGIRLGPIVVALALFTGIKPGPDGRPDAAALARERLRGFVVVRLRLDGGAYKTRIVAA